ncbi:MAG: GNAT family N-acetyltransferase [Alphaproteobacteria bacterium]|nr:GNAT family N-acetyltransferase [Alphaproteobacteria bacterium]
MDLTTPGGIFDYVVRSLAAYYFAVDFVCKDADGALLLSSFNDEQYFNFAIHKEGELCDLLGRYMPEFRRFGRRPLVYISPGSSLYGRDVGLPKMSADSFMFLEQPGVLENLSVPEDVKIALNPDEEEFIKTWRAAFCNVDDVYGATSEATVAGMSVFFRAPPAGFSHFTLLAYKNGVPAATAAAVYTDDREFMLVFGLGTVPEFRGQGLGSALMKELMIRARDLGCRELTLQTETGTYNERYYEKIGFATRLRATLYDVEKLCS